MRSKTIILATGVIDIEPPLPDIVGAIKRGLIRHCPICDGYEVIDQKIGIIGYGKQGLKEALFMRTYSSDITLLTLGQDIQLTFEERLQLQANNIQVMTEPITKVGINHNKITMLKSASKEYCFDTVYSALGAKVRSDLAIQLGAQHTQEGCLLVDNHQQTTITGLYAAGDLIAGLNQIW